MPDEMSNGFGIDQEQPMKVAIGRYICRGSISLNLNFQTASHEINWKLLNMRVFTTVSHVLLKADFENLRLILKKNSFGPQANLS